MDSVTQAEESPGSNKTIIPDEQTISSKVEGPNTAEVNSTANGQIDLDENNTRKNKDTNDHTLDEAHAKGPDAEHKPVKAVTSNNSTANTSAKLLNTNNNHALSPGTTINGQNVDSSEMEKNVYTTEPQDNSANVEPNQVKTELKTTSSDDSFVASASTDKNGNGAIVDKTDGDLETSSKEKNITTGENLFDNDKVRAKNTSNTKEIRTGDNDKPNSDTNLAVGGSKLSNGHLPTIDNKEINTNASATTPDSQNENGTNTVQGNRQFKQSTQEASAGENIKNKEGEHISKDLANSKWRKTKKRSSTSTENIEATSETRLKTRPKFKTKLSLMPVSEGAAAVEADPRVKSIYCGSCTFASLPPLSKKAVRIFVSSTFSDTKEERNALMKHVYPRLAEFCRQKHGLEFQVVDMRWGVPEQAAENHSTTDLCLQEIKKCQEVSVGPCFVAIVGNKYGFRPIPTEIGKDIFEKLTEAASTDGWDLVQEWYLKDENAEPVVYVLQPISKMFPDIHSMEKEKQRESWQLWEKQNGTLKSTLRKVARTAFEKDLITEAEMHQFYMSVTESEITEGIYSSVSHAQDTSLCIIRDIPDIKDHTKEEIAQKFIDLTSDKATDEEAQSLLSSLRQKQLQSRLPDPNITQVTIDWLSSGANVSLENSAERETVESTTTLHIAKHKEYLDLLCKEFYEKISGLIEHGSIANSNLYDEMTAEILHHLHIARGRCEVFEGREDIIKQAKMYLTSATSVPLVIHGKSGCGKTSVLAKIFECIVEQRWMKRKNSETGPDFLMIVRFLGTTPQTSNLYLLIVSICNQLSQITGKPWSEPSKFGDLVKSFHALLEDVSTTQPVVLLLDSIDQLIPAYNAYKMNWLPGSLPPSVKIIVSSIEEGYPILKALQDRYNAQGATFLEVTQLGDALGLKVISKWLSLKKRKINDDQATVVKQALSWCSLPLYVRIAYDQIRKWRSYDKPTTEALQVTVKGAINQMFSSMESKFGQALVQHSLGYLTASRHGLSEVELEHLLSLDDELLNKIYKFWKPPIRRIPPLLWTRIRAELSSYIVERSADDIIVLFWYHRQFIEATRERYLKKAEFTNMIHSNMVDFFLGKWGGGKPKPFQYTEHQKKRFKLESTNSEADRKVPEQPYIIKAEVNGETEIRFNKRKLFELPFHLAKIKNYSLLKSEIFFNFEWLFSTLKCSSAMSVLDEFKIFMASEKHLRRDMDMKLLFANMRMIRPYITTFPDTLPYELCGRLAKYISSSQLMNSLIKQCDIIGSQFCPITPIITCFPTATVGLQQNINYRPSESWHRGGAFTCSKDFKTMYIIDHDDLGICQLSSWDVESGEMIQTVPITWQGDEIKRILYVQVVLDPKEVNLVGFNRGKDLLSLNRGRKYRLEGEDFGFGDGNVDIISKSDGMVLQSFSESFQAGSFFNPFVYMTENWVAARMGNKTPLYSLHTDVAKSKRLNKPHVLSKNEALFILSNSDGTTMKKFHGKELLGEFDPPAAVYAVTITDDNNVVLLAGPELGELRVYNLSRKMLRRDKLYGFILKTKFILTLPQLNISDLEKVCTNEKTGRLCPSVHMIISTDMEYALIIYLGYQLWVPLLYNIYKGKRISSFVGQIGQPVAKNTRFPAFSHDNQHVVVAKNCVNGKKVVQIFSVASGHKVQEFFIEQAIKDYFVSKVNDQIAVMTGKDVAFFSIGNPQEDSKASKKRVKAKKKPVKEVTDQTLMQREELSNKMIHNELVMIQSGVDAIVEEVEGAAHVMDTDTVASARSKRKLAHDMHYTPDGLKVVQLHSRVQVVDLITEDIKYTPNSGDTITRTALSAVDGQAINETVKIPTGTGLIKPIDLQMSDRIVNENNKIKYRAASAGRNQIAFVPSVITVYTATEGKMKRLQRFMVYQETIQTVSNKFIVTSKQKSGSDYVNIYEMETGNLLATHDTDGLFSKAVIPRNESLLITVDQQLVVRAYQAPTFNSCEIKILTREIKENKKATVSDILCCKSPQSLDEGGNSIVIHYKPIRSVAGKFCYQLVNLVTKEVGKHLVQKEAFEDISVDGEFAIDAQLWLYSLKLGERVYQVPYANRSEKMNLRIKFSDDLKYIVFVDKMNDTLNVVQMEGTSSVHIASCYTHAPKMQMFNGLSVRQNGRLIMIKSQDAALILLKIQEKVAEGEKGTISYNSEMDRASTMAALCKQPKVRGLNGALNALYDMRKQLREYSSINSKDH